MEEDNAARVSERLAHAEHIEDILRILADHEDQRLYQAAAETNAYLDDNFNAIVQGVLHHGNNEFRNTLGHKLDAISDDVIPDLRRQVKEALKAKMRREFEDRRPEFVKGAIGEVSDFRPLYNVLKRFQYVVVDRDTDDTTVDYEEAIGRIEAVRIAVESQERWRRMEHDEVDRELDVLLEQFGVPKDSGIRRKVKTLLRHNVKDRWIRHAVTEPYPRRSTRDHAENSAAPGWFRRAWSKIAFWKR